MPHEWDWYLNEDTKVERAYAAMKDHERPWWSRKWTLRFGEIVIAAGAGILLCIALDWWGN